MPSLLNAMSIDRANQILRHPLHQTTSAAIEQLIIHLRQCRNDEDYFEFQQDLLTRVLAVQAYRQECSRVQKRLMRGRPLPSDAPDPQSGEPPRSQETWDFEIAVCERVDRQLRSIADALAWRLFNYDRRIIIALSRNQPTGQMAGSDSTLR